MAKKLCIVGFAISVETSIGVFQDVITPKQYVVEVERESRSFIIASQVNPNMTTNNKLKIILDDFAFTNHIFVRYVELDGVKWSVKSIDIERPRLVLHLGGVYNGA